MIVDQDDDLEELSSLIRTLRAEWALCGPH